MGILTPFVGESPSWDCMLGMPSLLALYQVLLGNSGTLSPTVFKVFKVDAATYDVSTYLNML